MTGESAPVIRESGGDRSSAVTGGTIVLSDRIVVRITSEPGQSFVDRMIALVEGSERQRTPNEIALNVLLSSLTAGVRRRVRDALLLRRLQRRAPVGARAGRAAGLPDPDHDRRTALGHRHRRHGPAGTPQRAGHVGPCGRGGRRRRRAAARQDRAPSPTATGRPPSCCPCPGWTRRSWPRRRCCRRWPTRRPRGGSIVALVEAGLETGASAPSSTNGVFVPFSATTRMSGLDVGEPPAPQGRGVRGDRLGGHHRAASWTSSCSR